MNYKSRSIDATNMSDEQLQSIPASVVSLSFGSAEITDKGISNLPFLHSIKA